MAHQPSTDPRSSDPLSPSPRSTIRRGRTRARTERDALYNLLDNNLICHLGMTIDSSPVVLPTCYGRDGDTVYVHGSSGAASLQRAAHGAAVCLTVTQLDGIVYARAVFHFSVNYASAVIHGTAHAVTQADDKLHGLRVIVEHLAPGSWDHARQPTGKELAATTVLRLPLTEASVKIRNGPPVDDDADVEAARAWAGVLPLRQFWDTPVRCPLLPTGTAAPAHVTARSTPDGPRRHRPDSAS